jgi:hypothetical protein
MQILFQKSSEERAIGAGTVRRGSRKIGVVVGCLLSLWNVDWRRRGVGRSHFWLWRAVWVGRKFVGGEEVLVWKCPEVPLKFDPRRHSFSAHFEGMFRRVNHQS